MIDLDRLLPEHGIQDIKSILENFIDEKVGGGHMSSHNKVDQFILQKKMAKH